MMNEQEFNKKVRHYLRKLKERTNWEDNLSYLPLLKRVVERAINNDIDILEEYDTMIAWCEHKKKDASVLRFNNWIKRRCEDKPKQDYKKF